MSADRDVMAYTVMSYRSAPNSTVDSGYYNETWSFPQSYMIEDIAAYEPWTAFAPHSAAKAAQAMLTRIFAKALAPEVRVCGIAPGPVAVEPEQVERRAAETLLARVGSPEDVPEAVVFLAGAEFVTGTTLVVDGGALLQSARQRQP